MKKLIFTVLLASLSLTSFAAGYADKQQDRLIKQLDLNAQQSEQMQSIFDSKAEQRKELYQQMVTLREQTNSEIKAILTPEQLEKFQQMQDKRQKKMNKHHSKKNGGGV